MKRQCPNSADEDQDILCRLGRKAVSLALLVHLQMYSVCN